MKAICHSHACYTYTGHGPQIPLFAAQVLCFLTAGPQLQMGRASPRPPPEYFTCLQHLPLLTLLLRDGLVCVYSADITRPHWIKHLFRSQFWRLEGQDWGERGLHLKRRALWHARYYRGFRLYRPLHGYRDRSKLPRETQMHDLISYNHM